MVKNDTHSHHHSHHHSHFAVNPSVNRAFIVGIILNVVFVGVEFGVGLFYNSLGLISDAGHNLGDVTSLILALLAVQLTKISPSDRYTYGYKKSTVLVSLLNAIILLVAVGFIVVESIEKFSHPAPIEGGAIMWTAGIGVVINAFTAFLFLKDKDKDLNVKGAYLHMAADALVSVGVVLSGALILFTGWVIIDAIIGLIIAAVIVVSTWGLLRDSLRLSLDGVPMAIDNDAVRQVVLADPDVVDCHHLHIWALSTTDIALTVHVVLREMSRMEEIKSQIKANLVHLGIGHATLEFEHESCMCDQEHRYI
ncbi:MAG: cation diffusion facilitator family transporter [Bacteroides sp.]